ncbi:MAG: hypothetical protein OMOMHJEC_02468 [Xanthomonadales bacterium]|nr:hypothetical protein [Xanthomonadales bacterium]
MPAPVDPLACAAALPGNPVSPPVASPPAPGDSAWRERLAHLRLLATERSCRQTGRSAGARAGELPGRELAPGLRLHEVRVGESRARLAGLELAQGLRAPWSAEVVDREQLCLFDTETSGLAGGVGLKVFLLGVLRRDGDGWLLRQYLLTRLAGEAALVDAWAEECRGVPWLVSYNGKRFDLPALRTLETLHRRGAVAAGLGHWDLLYPVRRAFRGRWPDCRLTTAERMLAGRERAHDLPGGEAPRAWRTFLAHGDTGDLLRVMQHNRFDLEALLRVLRALLAMPETRFETGCGPRRDAEPGHRRWSPG